MSQQETLLTFPCSFPIKIMGLASEQFTPTMLALAAQYIDDIAQVQTQERPSKNGTYTALTLTFEAQSQDQLDQLYRDFSAHPHVRMVL